MSNNNNQQFKLSDTFVLPHIRPKQKEVLDQIQEGINSGIKTFLLEMPTGGGKSPVAVTLARALGSSIILTSTKDLQEQYVTDFPFIRKAVGRGNFECREVVEKHLFDPKNPATMFCDNAPCQAVKEYDCQYMPKEKRYVVRNINTAQEQVVYYPIGDEDEEKLCSYYDQKHKAMKASHSILNYKMFIGLGLLGGQMTPRDLLVIDECHKLEDELTEVQGLTISEAHLRNFFPDNRAVLPQDMDYDLRAWLDYCAVLADSLRIFINTSKSFRVYSMQRARAMEDLRMRGQSDFQTNPEFERIDTETRKRFNKDDLLSDAQDFLRKIGEFVTGINQGDDWIVAELKRDEKRQRIVSVTIKPLSVRPLVQKVFNMANYQLLMSATIMGKDAFCSILGINPNEVLYISVGSDFPIEHRRIYPLDIMPASAKNEHEYIPAFAKVIDKIMSKYPDKKGIIHTTSYKQSQQLKEHISLVNKRRLLETGEVFSREQLIREHKNTDKPTVILSPSMRTGLDLKDDLSRFQIIVKVPYLYLGDRVVEAKKNKNPKWYTWSTLLELIQAYGRSIRSAEDYADTFILDENFSKLFLRQTRDMMPKWVSEAIVTDKENQLIKELLTTAQETDKATAPS